MRLLAFLLFLLLGLVHAVDGQTLSPEVYSCFGGTADDATVQLTWTAGEPIYTTVQNSSNILTQGFNQSLYVTSVPTGIEEVSQNSIMAYPNPTTSIVNVALKMEKQRSFDMQLFDLSGKKLLALRSSSDLEQIDVSQFATGVYLLKISDSKQIVKTFKIEKVQ